MFLVAFQKIFRKIFSGVWKRRRKTQIQKNTSHNPDPVRRPRRRLRSEIAIDGVIAISPSSRDRDRRCDPRLRSTARSREASIAISDLPLSPSIAISIQRDLATARLRSTARSRDGEIAINGAISRRRDRDQWRDLVTARSRSSLLLSRAHAFSLSLIFRKCFEGKIEV